MNKLCKVIISMVVCFVVVFSSFAFSTSVSAFNYPKISLGASMSGALEDYFGGISYELNLNGTKKVNISYSSTAFTDFCVFDDKLNTVLKVENTKSVTKTIALKKGIYVFGIYNCGYEKGTYSLSIKDDTVYAQTISFENSSFTLCVGDKVKAKIIKEPQQSKLRNLGYRSSDEKVATVNKNGKITAVGLGKAVITAQLDKKSFTQCTVLVSAMKLNVFKKAKKRLGQAEGFYSSDLAVVKLVGGSVKGVSQGNATLTKYFNGEKYTVNVQVTTPKKLIKAGKRKLKKAILNSDSLIVFNTYRGYNFKGKACVVIDYGIENADSITGRKYFICYYNDDFTLNYRYASKMPLLKNLKEV